MNKESHLNAQSFLLLKLMRPELMTWITFSEIAEFDIWLTHVRVNAMLGGEYL